jgi:hypothetical protein
MLDDRYMAGLFDGEGCIMIRVCKPTTKTTKKGFSDHTRYQLYLTLNMTFRPIMEEIYREYGGKFSMNRHDLRNPNQRICFVWTITSQKAKAFLQRIYPYLIVKKTEAELALKFQENVDAHTYQSENPLRSHPNREAIMAERQRLADEIKALKHVAFPPLEDNDPRTGKNRRKTNAASLLRH